MMLIKPPMHDLMQNIHTHCILEKTHEQEDHIVIHQVRYRNDKVGHTRQLNLVCRTQDWIHSSITHVCCREHEASG